MTDIRKPQPLMTPQHRSADGTETSSAKSLASSAATVTLEPVHWQGRSTDIELAEHLSQPLLPPHEVGEQSISGAQSFSANLLSIDARSLTGDELLAGFLKLQILDSSLASQNDGLTAWAASNIALSALADERRLGKELESLEGQSAQAEVSDAQAQSAKEQGDAILRESNIDPNEVQQLVEQSVVEGKNGDDVVDRYVASRPEGYDAQQLQHETDAIRQAEPYWRQAASHYESARDLENRTQGVRQAYASALIAVNSVRKGNAAYQALLKEEARKVTVHNDLLALLAGEKNGKKALLRAWAEVDQARNEVAKLVLQLADAQSDLRLKKLKHRS